MKKITFLKNAFILTATSLILRTVGIFFRVYLSNKIGAEGMGLYQLVFSIYILASTFAISGISTAVTRLVSEEADHGTRKSIRRILIRAVFLSVVIGILSALIVVIGAKPIAKYCLGDERAVAALQILSVSLPFMGVSSCMRGYFIARRRVSSTSRAQMLEQLIRIGVILLIIDRFAAKGLSAACAAVMIGDTLAEITSCLYLAVGYFLDRRRLPVSCPAAAVKRKSGIFRRMLSIAVPISAGRYLNTVLRTIENLLVPNCLSRYSGSKERALSEFGMLKGMAMPILFFPSSFLSAFSTLMIPEVSEATVLNQTYKITAAVKQTMRITLLFSVPISGIFAIFSKQLGILIYHSEEVGFLIGVLAPIMPFMYLESVVDGLLKGLNQQVSSLKYSILDSVLRIGTIIFLVPWRGIQGFLFIMIVSNIMTSLLNVHRLLVVTNVRMQWFEWVVKPLLAILTACVAAYYAEQMLNSNTSLSMLLVVTGCSLAAVLLYTLLLFLFGSISREDFRWLKKK